MGRRKIRAQFAETWCKIRRSSRTPGNEQGGEGLCKPRSIANTSPLKATSSDIIKRRQKLYHSPFPKKRLLNENGIGYEHLPETGGKNKPTPEEFVWGINRIIEIASDARTVMMCSEFKPITDHKIPRANCHRVGLLAPALRAKGIERIIHILPNGESIEFDESIIPSIW